MNTAIVVGSIADIAVRNNTTIAESFLNCELITIVDVSGSMEMRDSRDGQSRYHVALEELAKLQAGRPGKVAVIAFSDSAQFVPGGVPPMLGGSTNLAAALGFARIADSAQMRFVVISDGYPDDSRAALAEAATYQGRIDTVFIGPENDVEGRSFLQKLAAANGGQAVTADRAKELAATIETLLLHA